MRFILSIKIIFFIVFVVLVGFFSLSLFFADLGPSETETDRLIASGFFFLITGFIAGLFLQKKWRLVGLMGWATVLFGLTVLFGSISEKFDILRILTAFGIIIFPVAILLCGGLFGSMIVQYFQKGRTRK